MTALPKWDLTDLYQGMDDEKLNQDKDILVKKITTFSNRYQSIFSNNKLEKNVFLNAIKDYEFIQNLTQKMAVYGRLLSFINLDKPEIQSFFQEIIEFLTTQEQKLIFFTIALNNIDDTVLDDLLKSSSDLLFYKPWLRRVRAFKPHQLDEKMEQLLSDKGITSNQMWQRLFDETLSKMRFDYEGEFLGIAAISHLLSDKDADIRKNAAISISETLKKEGDLFVTITNVLAKDLEIQDKWRRFERIGDSRHLANDVEFEVVENLSHTVKKNYKSIAHRYYALKAKLLGVDKLDYWDRNAPLPFDSGKVYSWDEAKDIVLNAYDAFSPIVKAEVQKFFDNPWIDAKESPSKYSGAFNMPTFEGHHPYILLNFKGTLRDVTTLAHELGHGIHSLFAGDKGIFMEHAPLTLCETASVFGEMLTFQYLLKQTENQKSRIQALESKISDMVNTVVRQIAFYDFEYKLHEQRRKGTELSRDQLNALWLSTQKEALGESVDVPDVVKEFWMTIPHFIHSPFYVYSYAFGDCLVNSLYQYYQNHPGGFEEKYIDMLKAGGTKHHTELLKPFDLDAKNPDFWQEGLTLITSLLDQLEKEMNND